MSATRIGVMASGSGSNLQALIEHFALPSVRDVGEIVWVGANRPDAGALVRASSASIPAAVVNGADEGEALTASLAESRVELLVLAGYLKRIPAQVVRAFHGRMLNIHPALLPSFGGAGMYGERVHSAVIASGARITGVTIHFVNEEYDRGAIVAQWPVAVREDDTPATLAARVLRAEHRLYPRCVAAVAAGVITLGDDGRAHGLPESLQPDFLELFPGT
jgi:formyltetrahydrofolate-dependent phosphoribosylglycinamide formyltransferase